MMDHDIDASRAENSAKEIAKVGSTGDDRREVSLLVRDGRGAFSS